MDGTRSRNDSRTNHVRGNSRPTLSSQIILPTDHCAPKDSDMLKEELLDKEEQIAMLTATLQQYKRKDYRSKTKFTTESEHESTNYSLPSIVELSQEVDEWKSKYTKCCETIGELEGKLRAALSDARSNEDKLNAEIERLKGEISYLHEEKSRSTDNLKVLN